MLYGILIGILITGIINIVLYRVIDDVDNYIKYTLWLLLSVVFVIGSIIYIGTLVTLMLITKTMNVRIVMVQSKITGHYGYFIGNTAMYHCIKNHKDIDIKAYRFFTPKIGDIMDFKLYKQAISQALNKQAFQDFINENIIGN